MKIFILDDRQERHDAYKKKFKGCDITSTYTAEEAISVLSTNLEWNYILLDHDLGGEIFVDTKEYNTGTTVAKFLSDKPIKGHIIIHSLNFPAAQHMLDYLPAAIYFPFFWI